MLTSVLLYLFYGIVWTLTRPFTLLPDVSMPVGISAAFGNIQAYLAAITPVFPITDLIIALGILVTFELSLKAFESFGWIIRKIPGGMS